MQLNLNTSDFLAHHPMICRSTITPAGYSLRLCGFICENVIYADKEMFLDYEIELLIPNDYPRRVPELYIINDGKYMNYGPDGHFLTNGMACLGVSSEIKEALEKDASLETLWQSLILPYLSGLSYWKTYGKYPYYVGSHGKQGWIEYFYRKGLHSNEEICKLFEMISKKKKAANKEMCPFGCGMRYGKCQCKGSISHWKYLLTKRQQLFLQMQYSIGITVRQQNKLQKQEKRIEK